MIADGNPVISYYWGPCACMSYSGEVHAVIRCWFHFSYILASGPRVRPDYEGLSTFSYCIFRAVVLVVLGPRRVLGMGSCDADYPDRVVCHSGLGWALTCSVRSWMGHGQSVVR